MTQSIQVKIKKLDHAFETLPFYQTEGSSGMDLYACSGQVVKPLQRCLVDCGISIELPNGLEAQVRPRSGLAFKKGITVLNTPGTIDADYRGEIKVILINLGEEDFEIKRGDRIAQMVIAPIQTIEWKEVVDVDNTSRSAGGFGHTGV
jgi:dUTP pyrophosphatase